LRQVEAWVRQYEAFWERQLQSFKNYVEAEVQKERSDDQES